MLKYNNNDDPGVRVSDTVKQTQNNEAPAR